jgi:YVTN family beta-propeller protein
LNANTVSVIATANNTITGTVSVGSGPIGVAMAAAPAMTLQITEPLSPTQPNVFDFGTYDQAVQYPPGTSFSGVNMTTTAVQITQVQFQQRVAGTQFARAACVVYSGTGGNCMDFLVTCSDNNGNSITCPGEPQPTIAVETDFSTSQAIVNPGYLTTPIGQNQWTDILTGFVQEGPLVRTKGKTSGFSEFVAVDLGATNPQGMAKLKIIRPQLPKTFYRAHEINFEIRLTSLGTKAPVRHAKVGMSIVMVADGHGNPAQEVMFSSKNAFRKTDTPGVYSRSLPGTAKYPPGTYNVTIYGDAFAAYQGQFKILH